MPPPTAVRPRSSTRAVVERTRASLRADWCGVDPARVAIGSQASVFAGLIAAAVPDGAEVLCVEGDFSSMVLPFAHAGRGIRLRIAPLDELADAITADTWLVAFSLVQSATGEVADAAAIRAAAARHGARTLCDATQAVGWLPVDAADYDAVICHAYKWLCAPRGVAFLTISEEFAACVPAVFAGWYAGSRPVGVLLRARGGTGPGRDALRRLARVAGVRRRRARARAVRLARRARRSTHTRPDWRRAFRAGLGLEEPARPSAIVTWSRPRRSRPQPAHGGGNRGIRPRRPRARRLPRLQRRAGCRPTRWQALGR